MPDETKTNIPADGIEQSAPETPAEPTLPGGETPAPDIPAEETPAPETTAEDAPAPAHDGAEQPDPPPLDLDGKQPPGDNVVDFDSISQKQGAVQEPPAPDVPAPDLDREAALRREQEALLAEMDQRAAFHDEKFSRAAKEKAAKDKPAPAAEKQKRPGRPPKPGKAEKQNGDKSAPGAGKTSPAEEQPKKPRGRPPKADTPAKEETPPAPAAPEAPPPPRESPRPNEPEQIVHIKIDELHAFKNHPFAVRDDAEMRALMESVKEKGVNQPIIARPREDGGYEIIAGHRRQFASRLAGFTDVPCIVRNMTDDEAILAMTDDNLRQRSEILPSEKALSLKMQVDAIKHQGARDTSGQNVPNSEAGKLSIDIVGERNNMNAKQVQRYVSLTRLVPDLSKAVDEKRLGFTTAVEISFIKPRNQNYIAVAMEAEQSSPSLAQAQRLRELDKKGELSGDVIDGILGEQKKEEIKVIISGKELEKYFGNDKTPQQMKEQIVKLLDEWAGKEKEKPAPEKTPER